MPSVFRTRSHESYGTTTDPAFIKDEIAAGTSSSSPIAKMTDKTTSTTTTTTVGGGASLVSSISWKRLRQLLLGSVLLLVIVNATRSFSLFSTIIPSPETTSTTMINIFPVVLPQQTTTITTTGVDHNTKNERVMEVQPQDVKPESVDKMNATTTSQDASKPNIATVALAATTDGGISSPVNSSSSSPVDEKVMVSDTASTTTNTNVTTTVTTTTTPTTTTQQEQQQCAYTYSESWLKGPRYNNLQHDPLLTSEYASKMILNLYNLLRIDDAPQNSWSMNLPHVMEQTICHSQSRLLNHTLPVPISNDKSSNVVYDKKTLRVWSVKLMYLALHYHQHRPAIAEARARYRVGQPQSTSTTTPVMNVSCPLPDVLQKQYGVGVMDYECPDAKYIVLALNGNGLGANVRLAMVPALMIGLLSNRIVIFANNVPNAKDRFVQGSWALASCSERLDYQCFFLPTTPCTLTHDEIRNAYALSGDETRSLLRSEQLPRDPQVNNHKVWKFQNSMNPIDSFMKIPAERLYKHAQTLIAAIAETSNPPSEYMSLLQQAAETILLPDERREGYHYAAASYRIQHVFTMYSLRPNPTNAQKLNSILANIVPPSYNPETSLGLPIRASDKCNTESECMSFDQHMQVTSDLWQTHENVTGMIRSDPTIVFTTEAISIAEQHKAFVQNNNDGQTYPYKFSFITNSEDVTPDTGFMKETRYNNKSKGKADADTLMLSAMSSLKAQLLPRISIGNCCSNFHTMLNDFLYEGCGAASENTFVCLNEYKDPLLRVCCGWHHKCKEEKKALVEKLAREANATKNAATAAVVAVNGSSTAENRRLLALKTAATRTTNETDESCGFRNSDRWLQGPRFGNLHDDPLLTRDRVQKLILNIDSVLALSNTSEMTNLMGQTICHAKSRLLNSSIPDKPALDDDRTVRLWTIKLIYLALHYHQHRLAIPEAMARYGNGTTNANCTTSGTDATNHSIGVFDYECPDAKYLVMGLGGNGLGANVRGGMVPALAMGLMTDRIVVFVNNAAEGHHHLRMGWPLASCPRKDYQCFFQPTTPCVLTQDDIKKAYTLSSDETSGLLHKNVLPNATLNDHRVWRFQSASKPIDNFMKLASDTLYKHAVTLVGAVSEVDHPEYVALLKKALEAIRLPDSRRPEYHYTAATYKIQHGLTLYALRPNPTNSERLDNIMSEIIPVDFDAETSVGLPVRASDKCNGESDCLSFDQHMEVTSSVWSTHQNLTGIASHPTVVFTTESTSMVKEQLAFVVKEQKEKSFPHKFNFLTNTKDITPDSGFMKEIVWNKKGKMAADDIMLSAVSSLKTQLLPRVSIGNCCSNFHAVLGDMLSEGCGAASDNTFICLQENKDPILKICCGWHHSCKARKKEALLKLAAEQQSSTNASESSTTA